MQQKTIAILSLLLTSIMLIGTMKFDWHLFQVFSGCKVIKPLWSYYSCEKSPNMKSTYKEISTSGIGTWQTLEKTIASCDANHIVPNALYNGKSCLFEVTDFNAYANTFIYVCNLYSCTPIAYSGNPTPEFSGKPQLYKGFIVYMDKGEYLKVKLQKPLFGDAFLKGYLKYYVKTLYLNTYTGYRKPVGVGCNLQGLISSEEYGKLPQNAKGTLEVGDTQPFISDYQEFPHYGNVYNYNGKEVIAVPAGNKYWLYEVKRTVIPTTNDPQKAKTESGVYYAKSGACYLIPSPNPIAEVECLPGMSLAGMVCKDWHWVQTPTQPGSEGGECRIASDCYGGIQYSIKGDKYIVNKWACINGKCVLTESKEVECLPPNIGCVGNAYCDPETYTCKKAEGALPDIYHGLQPEQPTFQFDWNLLALVLFPALGALLAWNKRNKARIAAGALIGLIIGIVIYWVLSLAWWQQLLLGLGLGAFGFLILYFFGGLLLLALAMVIKR